MLASLSRQAVIRSSVATLHDDETRHRVRLMLYPDRLELKGWSWLSRRQHIIPLTAITSLTVERPSVLHLHVHEGNILTLSLTAAWIWREAIESCQICLSASTQSAHAIPS